MQKEIEACLRPHQIEPKRDLLAALRRYRSAVDFSDTGTGKTYVACAVAAELELPTLIVVPKIAITAWHRAAEVFGQKFSVINYEKLRTGRTPYGTWSNPPPAGEDAEEEEVFICQCCQQKVSMDPALYRPCYCHAAGFHCLTRKKKRWDYGNFTFNSGVGAVIFDEVHRCNGLRSLNAELLIGAKRKRIVTLGLSATAACNPLQMRALGYSLDLHTLHPAGGLGFYDWSRRYGCRRNEHFQGFKWMLGEAAQRETMRTIRAKIIPSRGVRVRCEDIPGFPKCDITAELYDLDENNEIEKLYADMATALALVDQAASRDVNAELALTKLLRARQRVELLKVPIAVELHNDYLAKGYSVAVFCNFAGTISELSARLGCKAIIDGSAAGVRDRQKHIDEYQCNAIRTILANSDAGGISVSLQDLRGDHPRVGIVFPNFSAVSMRQVFGRLPRDGGKSPCHYRVIFAANSPEVGMARSLRAKSNNLDSLNDADLMPENFKLRGFTGTHTII